jgi:hypothetical protein
MEVVTLVYSTILYQVPGRVRYAFAHVVLVLILHSTWSATVVPGTCMHILSMCM